MKIYKISQNISVPQYLYHATYLENLDSILEHGLDPNYSKKNWESSKNVICLAPQPEIAESFAETSEVIEFDEEKEYLLDEIVILEVNTEQLNKNKFSYDSNIRPDEIETDGLCYEYKGRIPISSLRKIN